MVSDPAPSLCADSRDVSNGLPVAASEAQAYAQCDPQFAQAWLDHSGLDIGQVARVSCLSVAQVRQLLHGTDGSFYSPSIRQRAYRRMLALLGAPEPAHSSAAVVPAPAQAEGPSPVPTPEPLTEWTVHPSGQPEQAVSMTVDTSPRGRFTYTAWAWLGVALLLGAATAEWWHAWLRQQVPGWHAPFALETAQTLPATPDPPVPPAPPDPPAPSAQDATAAGSPAELPCAYVAQPVTTVMPAQAEKPGNYVFVQARSEAEVCVVDGERRVTQLRLKAGEQRSIHGTAPWQISGLDLNQIHIYFQGWRVMLPEMATRQVTLVERSR